MEVPWTKLAEELKDEIDRSPKNLEAKWTNNIVPRFDYLLRNFLRIHF